MIAAIRRLAIRGAPLIGVAGAYAVAMGAASEPVDTVAARVRAARPTAVNLAYAVDRVVGAALSVGSLGELAAATLAEARRIHEDEVAASRAIAVHGADFLGAGVRRLMTHCNTGFLAAPGEGTALAVAAELQRRGSLEEVFVCEARPLLQGARLTVWELGRLGVPHRLLVDSAAAGVLASGTVDAVVVGCDRVAANGDVANKVGTYGLALAARAAGVPFVVVGPCSTVDLACASGSEIPIEQREASEVLGVSGSLVTLPGTACLNPAFDVTPAALVSALVTERGVAAPVDGAALRELTALRV